MNIPDDCPPSWVRCANALMDYNPHERSHYPTNLFNINPKNLLILYFNIDVTSVVIIDSKMSIWPKVMILAILM